MPFELTSDVIAAIEKAVDEGEWPREAAKRLGASPKQAAAWMHAGEEHFDREAEVAGLTPHQRLCVELVGRVWIAEAQCENRWRQNWQKSLREGKGGSHWQGYATLLERRFPDRWRKREMEKVAAVAQSPEQEFRQMAEEKKVVKS